MKVRSLLLGSVAAAGLSTGAFAADLGVLTSLDVCDALGLSGLTISSETNCLQITGGVTYEFQWGDYEGDTPAQGLFGTTPVLPAAPAADNDGVVRTGAGQFDIATPGTQAGFPDRNLDWYSKVDAFVKFVATADSSFGPAKAVIKIKDLQEWKTINEAYINGKDNPNDGIAVPVPGTGADHTFGPIFDEAYVSVGDSTMLMAGKKGTIMKLGEDEPLNYTTLFNSEKVDKGVKWSVTLPDGGHVIQVVSDLGNGFSVSGGLENLQATGAAAGTAVGVIAYAGDGIAAHLTVAAGGILDGLVENWGYHAGFAGTFDMFKVVGAIAGDQTGYFNGLASASATFDIFTLAGSVEVVNVTLTQQGAPIVAPNVSSGEGLDVGVGASISAAVTDGITINLGGRWYRDANDQINPGIAIDDGYQVEASLVAAVTETLTLTGAIGVFGDIEPAQLNVPNGPLNGPYNEVYYGAATVAWAPGGDFTTSLKGEVYSNGAFKTVFKAAKTIQ